MKYQKNSYSCNMIISMVDCFLILCLLSIITPGKFWHNFDDNTPDLKGDTN